MIISLAGFICAAVVILLVGPRMARTANDLAAATGMGGAFFGIVFLSVATDLPEIALTPTAVLSGSPRIAIGGLIGSAAAQLLLIAVVDLAFRSRRVYAVPRLRVALANCTLMLAVLAVPLVVAAGDPALGPVGTGTLLMVLVYGGGLAAIRRIGRGDPQPRDDSDDEARRQEARSVAALWARFGLFALLLTGAGIVLEVATDELGSAIGIGETAAGALLAGGATSLPELVTALAAVRIGAIELAVGDIVGSSALDVALLAYADVIYTDGSIFHLLGRPGFTLIGIALALTALLVIGLIRRQGSDARPAGMETYLMIAVYVLGAAILIGANGAGA